MIGAEIPFLMAFLYPFLNYLVWFPMKRPELEDAIIHEPSALRGIQLYSFHTYKESPYYVNVNNIMIPVQGDMRTETRDLTAKHLTSTKTSYTNYWQIDHDTDVSKSFQSSQYLNTPDDASAIFQAYTIPMKDFRITLPLKVETYRYPHGAYLYQPYGLLATEKGLLVENILWRKRLPLTLTVPAVAATMLAFCWMHGWMQYYPMNHPLGYAPPFHPQRIRDYFAHQRSK